MIWQEKKIVRNALFCFQESLGSKAFVRLNMKDFLAEEDLGLKLYNIATKNDSKKQFFWLRNVVFDVFTKHVKMFFDEHVKYFSVTLDKGQLNSEGICEVIISPKMPTKNFKDFCPGSLLEGSAEIPKIFW